MVINMFRFIRPLLVMLAAGSLSAQQADLSLGSTSLLGAASGDNLGADGAVAVGDFNGDGAVDLAIASPGADAPGGTRPDAGSVAIVFGGAAFPAVTDLAGTFGAVADVLIYGAGAFDRLGSDGGLLFADLNGDGRDELVITASEADGPGNGRPGCGEVYIIAGQVAPPVTIDLAVDPQVTTVYGAEPDDRIGIHGALAAGDWNDQGPVDLAIGAYLADGPGNSRNAAGEVYILFGRVAFDWPASLDLATQASMRIAGHRAGDSLSRDGALVSGDLNHDGVADLVVGAEHADGPDERRQQAGHVYVLYGSASWGGLYDLAATPADVTIHGANAGDNLSDGNAILVGDFDGDGVGPDSGHDLIIGASFSDGLWEGRSDSGAIFFLRGGSLAPVIDLDLNQADVVIYGADAGDRLSGDGSMLLADFDGDGILDLAMAAIFGDGPGEDRPEAGEAYVIRGGPGLPWLLDLAVGDADSVVYGADAGDFVGRGNGIGAGDFNNDGFADLILVGFGADGPGELRDSAGEAYILRGNVLLPPARDLRRHEEDFIVYGASAGDTLGIDGSVIAGDFNGDDFDDLLIGAPFADGPGGRSGSGQAGLISGSEFPPAIKVTNGPLPTEVRIGETHTFSFDIFSKDGQLADFVITDLIPDGFQFVPGTFAISTSNAGISIDYVDEATNLTDAPGLLTIEVGINNTADGDFTNDLFAISFDVLIANDAVNQNEDVRSNVINAHNGLFAAFVAHDITIIEPVLQILKSVIEPDPLSDLDAGDPLTYELTIQHAPASLSNAYEVQVDDVLVNATDVMLVTQIRSVTNNGAAIILDFGIGGNQQSINGLFDLPLDASIVLVYDAVIQNSVAPGQAIPNAAHMTWSSLAGFQPNERTGTMVGANDHVASAQVYLEITDRPHVDHLFAPASLTIGEVGRMQLRIDLIEGITANTVVTNDLPTGFAYLPDSVDVTVPGPPQLEQTVVSINGTELTIDLGTVTNVSDNDSSNDYLLVDFDIQVLNHPSNENGAQRSNIARVASGGLLNEQIQDIKILEPLLDVTGEILFPKPAADVDAGDLIQYRVVIEHTADSSSDAFDVSFASLLNAAGPELTVETVQSFTASAGVIILAPLSVAVDDTSLSASFDLPLGESVEVIFDVLVSGVIAPGQSLLNEATADWVSLKDSPPQSRDGSDGVGGLNDYVAMATPTINVEPLMQPVVQAAPGTLRIGETGHFYVRVWLIEGPTDPLVVTHQFTDQTFVPGTLSIAYGTSGIVSDYQNEQTSASSATNSLSVLFGRVVNPPDNDPSNDYIDLEYDAVLDNAPGNQNGVDRISTIIATDTVIQQQADTTVRVLEPVLELAAIVTPDPGTVDAGDVITFQATISHTVGSGSDAHEVVLAANVDTRIGRMAVTNIVNTIVTGGATVTVPTDIDLDTYGLTGLYEIPVGGAIEVTFQAVVNENVKPADLLTSSSVATWTSLPGTVTGERTGDDSGGVDDHFLEASIVTPVRDELNAEFASIPDGISIGEVVTIETSALPIEGVIPNGSVEIDIPDGLTFQPGSITVTPAFAAPIVPFDEGTVGINGNTLTIPLGPLFNPGDNNVANDRITIGLDVVAVNLPANQDGRALTVAARTFLDGALRGQLSHDILVTEPELEAVIQTIGAPDAPDAADIIGYEVIVRHATSSTAAAFDADLLVTVDPTLGRLVATQITSITPEGDATIDTQPVIGGSGSILQGSFDIPLGGQIAIRYDAVIQQSVARADALQTDAALDWSSLNSAPPGERTGDDGEVGLNDYVSSSQHILTASGLPRIDHINPPLTGLVGQILHYELRIDVMEGNTPAVELRNILPTALAFQPGSLEVQTGSLGLLTGYVDEAQHLSLTGQDLFVNLGNVSNNADNNPNNDFITVEWDVIVLNNIFNDDGTEKTNIAAAHVETVLIDVDEFENLVIIEPDLTLTHTKLSPASNIKLNNGTAVTYELEIKHTADSKNSAYDVLIEDVLDGASGFLLVDSILSTGISPGVVTIVPTGGEGTGTLTGTYNIPLGGSVTIVFTATVQDGFTPGQSFDSVATLTWSSLPGTPVGERTGAGVPDPNNIDDYFEIRTVFSEGAEPEIGVLGGANTGLALFAGQQTVSLADNTDFGQVRRGQAGPVRSYTVQNLGEGRLDTTLTLPAGYMIIDPLAANIAGGASDVFTIQLDSSVAGQFNGDIVIGNNDLDESPFHFAVAGLVVAPNITVIGNGESIEDGSVDYSVDDHTDFGAIRLHETPVTRVFTVRNDGDDPLALGAVGVPPGFELLSDLSGTLQPGGLTTFSVRVDTGSLAEYTGTVTFTHSDEDESPFDFVIHGLVSQPEIAILGGDTGLELTSGQLTTAAADGTDLGLGVQEGTRVSSIFTIRNDGGTPLTLGPFPVTAPFTVTTTPPPFLGAGETAELTIELTTDTPGTYGGTVTVANDDPDENPFTFSVAGIVEPAPFVFLSVVGSPVSENRGTATVTASLSQATGVAVTINLSVGGTATPADYLITGTTIIVEAGQISNSVDIVTTRDTVTDPGETVILAIDSMMNGRESSPQQVTITITDEFPAAVTLYVDQGATGNNTGTSWANAYLELQSALDIARAGDQIWMADGTYTPGATRSDSFVLMDEVRILGGFAGSESSPDQRIAGAPTILSGDIGAPGDFSDNVYHVVTATGPGDDYILDSLTIRDGNANGPDSAEQIGGGVYLNNANLTITNSILTDSRALVDGGNGWFGALSPVLLSDSTVSNGQANRGAGIFVAANVLRGTNVTFLANVAIGDGGGLYNGSGTELTGGSFSGDQAANGGGIFTVNSAATPDLLVDGVSFSGTSVSGGGGGIFIAGGTVVVDNSSFDGCSAGSGAGIQTSSGVLTLIRSSFTNGGAVSGGGVQLSGGTATLDSISFDGNTATQGGALALSGGSATIKNTLMTNNTAANGGAIYAGATLAVDNATFASNSATDSGGALYISAGNTTVENSILWSNTGTAPAATLVSGSLSFAYSAVQGSGGSGSWAGPGTDLGGNISADPQFIDAANGNYELTPVGPAVDAGNNALVPAATLTDLAGAPRFVDDLNTPDTGAGSAPIVDMGALEMPQSPLASIGDFVWLDENADGIQQPAEFGVKGIPLDLLNSLGQVIDTTLSGNEGEYLFEDLIAGSYQVRVQNNDRPISNPGEGSDDALDSDFDLDTGLSPFLVITPGLELHSVDVGLRVGPIPVAWRLPQNVNIVDNSLDTFGHTPPGWDAGANSQSYLRGDGYAQTLVQETNTTRAIGLGLPNHIQSRSQIQYAAVLDSTGKFIVYEGTAFRGEFGTYESGDIIRVQVAGQVVTYWVNSDLRYTSNVPVGVPEFGLVVEAAFTSPNATLFDVRRSAPQPIIDEYFVEDDDSSDPSFSNGDTLTIQFSGNTNKPGGDGVQDRTAVDLMFAFSEPLGASYSGQWVTADAFRITILDITGGSINLGSATVTPTAIVPILDESEGSRRAQHESDALTGSFGSRAGILMPIEWVEYDPEIAVNGTDITRTDDTRKGFIEALSAHWMPGPQTFVETTVLQMDETRALGLNSSNSLGSALNDIDYALYLRPANGEYRLMKRSTVEYISTYFPGDRFRLETDGDTISLIQNGVFQHSFTDDVTYPLFVDGVLLETGATIADVTMMPVAPNIIQVLCSDPDESSPAVDVGDLITISFDGDTNQVLGPGTLSKDQVDSILTSSAVLGADYTGQWLDGKNLQITVTNASGSTVALGTVFTPTGLPPITHEAGSPASLVSGALIGNFGLQYPLGIPVTWQSPINVEVDGTTLVKTSANNNFDAGATGTQLFTQGNHFVSATINDATQMRAIGFGDATDSGAAITDILWGLRVGSDFGAIVENGLIVGNIGAVADGAVIKVEIRGSQVIYVVDGVDRGVSPTAIGAGDFPLRVESSLQAFAATLIDVRRSLVNGSRTTSSDSAVSFAGQGAVANSANVYYLPLQPGWNLVSLPLEPAVSTASELFANSAISGAVFSVAEDGSYVPAEDIAGGEGYWVFVGGESPVVVTVDGAPFALSSFVDGWNLKGVPYETAVPASLQVDAIHSFEAGRYYEHAAESILTIGLGYWIFTPEGGQVVW